MISEEMVQKSFLICCISNKLDGTEDDAIWQEDSNETKNEDSYEVAESANEDQDEKMWVSILSNQDFFQENIRYPAWTCREPDDNFL